MVDIILFVVFSAASAAAWNPASLIVFRFILGIGIGADYPIGVSYIAECVPTRLRGRLIVGAFAFQALGSLLGVLVGLAILKLDPSMNAWRVMLAFGVLPAIAVVLMRDGMPESVRWHLARGNYEKASHAASTLLEYRDHTERKKLAPKLSANLRSDRCSPSAICDAPSSRRYRGFCRTSPPMALGSSHRPSWRRWRWVAAQVSSRKTWVQRKERRRWTCCCWSASCWRSCW